VNNFTLNRVIPENIHTPPVERFLDCTPPPLRNFRSEGVFDDPLKKRPPPQEFPVLLNMDLFTLSIVIIIIIISLYFIR